MIKSFTIYWFKKRYKTEQTPYGVDDILVEDVFKVCFKTSNESSVQSLQFRFIWSFSWVFSLKNSLNRRTFHNKTSISPIKRKTCDNLSNAI